MKFKKLIACFAFATIVFCSTNIISADTLSGNLHVPMPVYEKVYYDVPLSKDTQDYVKEVCDKYQISETWIYALMRKESEFDKTKVSPTNDVGLMQVNVNTFNWLNEKFYRNKLSINNSKDRIEIGVFYLNYLRDYWQGNYEGISDEDLFCAITICYNRGLQGGINYIQKYGFDNEYLNDVLSYKVEIESKEVI